VCCSVQAETAMSAYGSATCVRLMFSSDSTPPPR